MERLMLVVLGGLLALDETSLGQFMISRPLVSATLAGWLLGDPAAGFLVGAVLECLYLPKLHVGGARFPDSAPAGVTAAAVAANPTGAGAAVIAVVAGLLIGEVGSRVVVLHRRAAGRLVPECGDGVNAAHVTRSHLSLIALDAVRGSAVTALGVFLVAPLAIELGMGWPLSASATAAFLWVVAAAGLGVLWASTGLGRRGSVLLGLGLAIAGLGLL
jgi:mannose/fructose/N-acetylgalactosamine-specific phosphotransferase system component IIC